MSIGIDVGNTVFRLAACGKLKAELVPGGTANACVAVGPELLLVGNEARRELDTKHDNILRHPISALVTTEPSLLVHPKGGEREMWPEGATAAILHQLKARHLKKQKEMKHLTIAIPPCLTSMERKQLAVAAEAAGFPDYDLLNTNVAAAFQWGVTALTKIRFDAHVLVIDAGSKFTSVSMVHVVSEPEENLYLCATVSSCRAFRYGGCAVDQRMLPLCPPNDAVLPRVFSAAVEKSKKELASLRDSELRVKDDITLIVRSDLTFAAAPLLFRIKGAVAALKAELPDDARLVTALLIGGSSRLVDLQTYVREELELRVEVADFDYLSALGAAVWSGAQSSTLERFLEQDVGNAAAGHTYWAVRGDKDEGVPMGAVDEVVQLFADGEDEAELAPIFVGNWIVLEHIAGSRPPLKPTEMLAFYLRTKVETEEGCEVVVKKGAGEDAGAVCVLMKDKKKSALVLTYVRPGSAADRARLYAYEGWRVQSVNGAIVQSEEDLAALDLHEDEEIKYVMTKVGLPRCAGDVEPIEITYVGWVGAMGGTLSLDSNGVVSGMSLPDPDMLTMEELKEQLDSDAALRTEVAGYAEARNALEAAVLRRDELDLTRESLERVCANAQHYFSLSEDLLRSEDTSFEAEEVLQLAELIENVLEAAESKCTDDALDRTKRLETSLVSSVPLMAEGAVNPLTQSRRSMTMTSFRKKTRRPLEKRRSTLIPEDTYLPRTRSALSERSSSGHLTRKRSVRDSSESRGGVAAHRTSPRKSPSMRPSASTRSRDGPDTILLSPQHSKIGSRKHSLRRQGSMNEHPAASASDRKGSFRERSGGSNSPHSNGLVSPTQRGTSPRSSLTRQRSARSARAPSHRKAPSPSPSASPSRSPSMRSAVLSGANNTPRHTPKNTPKKSPTRLAQSDKVTLAEDIVTQWAVEVENKTSPENFDLDDSVSSLDIPTPAAPLSSAGGQPRSGGSHTQRLDAAYGEVVDEVELSSHGGGSSRNPSPHSRGLSPPAPASRGSTSPRKPILADLTSAQQWPEPSKTTPPQPSLITSPPSSGERRSVVIHDAPPVAHMRSGMSSSSAGLSGSGKDPLSARPRSTFGTSPQARPETPPTARVLSENLDFSLTLTAASPEQRRTSTVSRPTRPPAMKPLLPGTRDLGATWSGGTVPMGSPATSKAASSFSGTSASEVLTNTPLLPAGPPSPAGTPTSCVSTSSPFPRTPNYRPPVKGRNRSRSQRFSGVMAAFADKDEDETVVHRRDGTRSRSQTVHGTVPDLPPPPPEKVEEDEEEDEAEAEAEPEEEAKMDVEESPEATEAAASPPASPPASPLASPSTADVTPAAASASPREREREGTGLGVRRSSGGSPGGRHRSSSGSPSVGGAGRRGSGGPSAAGDVRRSSGGSASGGRRSTGSAGPGSPSRPLLSNFRSRTPPAAGPVKPGARGYQGVERVVKRIMRRAIQSSPAGCAVVAPVLLKSEEPASGRGPSKSPSVPVRSKSPKAGRGTSGSSSYGSPPPVTRQSWNAAAAAASAALEASPQRRQRSRSPAAGQQRRTAQASPLATPAMRFNLPLHPLTHHASLSPAPVATRASYSPLRAMGSPRMMSAPHQSFGGAPASPRAQQRLSAPQPAPGRRSRTPKGTGGGGGADRSERTKSKSPARAAGPRGAPPSGFLRWNQEPPPQEEVRRWAPTAAKKSSVAIVANRSKTLLKNQ